MPNFKKLSKMDITANGKIPIYSADTTNNGIIGYCDKKPNYIVDESNLFYLVFGDHTRTTNIAETSFCVADNVKVLAPKFNSIKATLYIATAWKKSIPNLGYSRHWSKAKNVKFLLPIDSSGKLDFNFMEEYISKLEEVYVKELDNYLKINKLDNYELSDEEKKIYNQTKKYKSIKIGSLFDIHPTKSYNCTNRTLFATKGNVPVVTNTSLNNGIGGYVDLEPTEKGNTITYSDTTTADAIFYQPDDFVGYSHVQGLYPIGNTSKWNQKTLLYFLATFKKQARGRFDYATKFNRRIAANMVVPLPIDDKGNIDFKYMEDYITIQEKLTIKDVILWKDKMINKKSS